MANDGITSDALEIVLKHYPAYKGIFASNQINGIFQALQNTNQCVVINTDYADQPGKHWVVLQKSDEKKINLFDSLGLEIPNKEYNLNLLTYECYKKNIHLNNLKYCVQADNSDTCGAWCAFFIKYVTQFKHKCAENGVRIFELPTKHNLEARMDNDDFIHKWWNNLRSERWRLYSCKAPKPLSLVSPVKAATSKVNGLQLQNQKTAKMLDDYVKEHGDAPWKKDLESEQGDKPETKNEPATKKKTASRKKRAAKTTSKQPKAEPKAVEEKMTVDDGATASSSRPEPEGAETLIVEDTQHQLSKLDMDKIDEEPDLSIHEEFENMRHHANNNVIHVKCRDPETPFRECNYKFSPNSDQPEVCITLPSRSHTFFIVDKNEDVDSEEFKKQYPKREEVLGIFHGVQKTHALRHLKKRANNKTCIATLNRFKNKVVHIYKKNRFHPEKCASTTKRQIVQASQGHDQPMNPIQYISPICATKMVIYHAKPDIFEKEEEYMDLK